MNKPFALTGWVVAGLLLAATVSGQHEEHHQAAPKAEGPAPGPEMCKMMQQNMGDMHSKMMQSHNELQQMVNEMNTATGDGKVDAIARVVTAMAGHQAQMHGMEMDMMKQMMSHMGEHMMQGMPKAEQQEMMTCPMMKSMGEHGDTNSSGAEHQH
jgi:hypothetical protein